MRLSRRQFLKLGVRAGAALAFAPIGCSWVRSKSSPATGVWVNDVHSQLNPTRVQRVVRPASIGEIVDTVRFAAKEGGVVSVAGGRHAAGGQQFATDGVLVDMRGMNRVIALDADAGIVEAEGGILWPELMDELARRQSGTEPAWGIVQKQGVDRMSLGGSLGANIHGNGLTLPPFVGQVESFKLVDAAGRVRTCSRNENAELFSLAAGGYGLLGIVTSMRLRLMRRRKLRVTTQLLEAGDVVTTLARRKEEGCLYGDWHYSPDPSSNDFLRRGVLATYQPLREDEDVPVNEGPLPTSDDWLRLVTLAHVNRGAAFARYVESALGQSGDVVWSDTFQLDRAYVDNYHAVVDRELKARVPASESLVEFFVPRTSLVVFLDEVRADFLRHEVAMLYGTVRLAEHDTESVLAWARQPCAGVVFNFHVVHDDPGRRALADTFRRVVDIAARHDGTFYLTYHRFATRAQTELCHPRLPEFLRAKRRYDPAEVFQSDWYRHYSRMFANLA
ncbi:MAG TPA: FAD-binding oxidoreductase [Verrucomicrobiae bacterium]|nr:FAD-binding oxidoreductase [Verrucomicrobiae bacterium]